MTYTILIATSAERDLKHLDDDVLERIDARIVELGQDPRGTASKKLGGEDMLYRIPVTTRLGQYRVVYEIDDDGRCVKVLRVRHRKDVY